MSIQTQTQTTAVPLSKALSDFKFFSIASLALSIANLFTSGLGLFSIFGILLSAASLQASNPAKANVRVLKLFSCCQLLNLVIALVAFVLVTVFVAPVLSCACSQTCVQKAFYLLENDINPWIRNQTLEHDVLHVRNRRLQTVGEFATNTQEEEEEEEKKDEYRDSELVFPPLHVHRHRLHPLALIGRFIMDHTNPCFPFPAQDPFAQEEVERVQLIQSRQQSMLNDDGTTTTISSMSSTPVLINDNIRTIEETRSVPKHTTRLRIFSFPRLLLGINEAKHSQETNSVNNYEEEEEEEDRPAIWRIAASTLMRPSVQFALHNLGRFISRPPPPQPWHPLDREHFEYFAPPPPPPPMDCKVMFFSKSSSSSFMTSSNFISAPSSSPTPSPSASPSPSSSATPLPLYKNPLSSDSLIQRFNNWVSNAVQNKAAMWGSKTSSSSSSISSESYDQVNEVAATSLYDASFSSSMSNQRLLKKVSEKEKDNDDDDDKEEEKGFLQRRHSPPPSKEVVLGQWISTHMLNITEAEFANRADGICTKGWVYYGLACIPFLAWIAFLRAARSKAILLFKHTDYIAADVARRQRRRETVSSTSSPSSSTSSPSSSSPSSSSTTIPLPPPPPPPAASLPLGAEQQSSEPLYRFVQGVGFVLVTTSSSQQPQSLTQDSHVSSATLSQQSQRMVPSAPPAAVSASLYENPGAVGGGGGDYRSDIQDAFQSIFDPVRDVFSRWNSGNNSYTRVETADNQTEDPTSHQQQQQEQQQQQQQQQQRQERYTDASPPPPTTQGASQEGVQRYPRFPTV
jgi:hypothetical protein